MRKHYFEGREPSRQYQADSATRFKLACGLLMAAVELVRVEETMRPVHISLWLQPTAGSRWRTAGSEVKR